MFQTHTHTHTKEPDGWGPPHSLILLAVQRRVQPHLWRNEGEKMEQKESGVLTLSVSGYLEDWQWATGIGPNHGNRWFACGSKQIRPLPIWWCLHQNSHYLVWQMRLMYTCLLRSRKHPDNRKQTLVLGRKKRKKPRGRLSSKAPIAARRVAHDA